MVHVPLAPLLVPAWFPSDEVLVAVIVLLLGLAVLNRNFSWIVERIDVLPAVALAAGVFLLVGGTDWVLNNVTQMGGESVWLGAGAIAVVAGVVLTAMDFRD